MNQKWMAFTLWLCFVVLAFAPLPQLIHVGAISCLFILSIVAGVLLLKDWWNEWYQKRAGERLFHPSLNYEVDPSGYQVILVFVGSIVPLLTGIACIVGLWCGW